MTVDEKETVIFKGEKANLKPSEGISDILSIKEKPSKKRKKSTKYHRPKHNYI